MSTVTVTMERHIDVRRHSTFTAEVPVEMIGDRTYFENGRATAAFDRWMCDNGDEGGVEHDPCDEDNLYFEVGEIVVREGAVVSTLNLEAYRNARGLRPEDDYADEIDRLRITREPDSGLGDEADADDCPWMVDGINTKTGQVSMWAENYATFESAVAALPLIWEDYVAEPARIDAEIMEPSA